MAVKGVTILVVDDEQLVRENLAAFLEDEGYAVEQAASGEEALQKVSAGGVDLAIVDMRLPGIDGNTVILRAHAMDPRMAFIIHTGSSSYSLPEELIGLGIAAEHVMRKPVSDMSQFMERIEERLQWRRTQG